MLWSKHFWGAPFRHSPLSSLEISFISSLNIFRTHYDICRGSTRNISFNWVTTSGPTKVQNTFLNVLSKCLLNVYRLGTSMTSPGSWFQCLTTLLAKKCSLMSSLNLSWCRSAVPPDCRSCIWQVSGHKWSFSPLLLPHFPGVLNITAFQSS